MSEIKQDLALGISAGKLEGWNFEFTAKQKLEEPIEGLEGKFCKAELQHLSTEDE